MLKIAVEKSVWYILTNEGEIVYSLNDNHSHLLMQRQQFRVMPGGGLLQDESGFAKVN